MSAFEDCIRSAVASGKIKQKKGDEALEAYEQAIAAGVAEGLSEQAARDAAGLKAVETMGARTQARKWEKINELRKQHALYQRMMASTDKVETLRDITDEVDIAIDRVRNLMHSQLNDFIERSRPRAAGLITPVRHLDDIVYASYGKVKQPEARELAESISHVMDFGRKLANREGASIPDNKNVRIPQMHSTLKVRRIKPTIGESKITWVDDHLEALDWEIMRYHGEKIPVNERRAVLERVFDTIASWGDDKIQPGIPNERLTERLAAQRFLYYKDADAWLRMNKKYGEGNLFEQTIGMVETMARNIALMEKFGPNPAASVNFMFKAAQKKAAEQSLAPGLSGKAKSPKAKVDKAIADFIQAYNMQSRNLVNADESKLVNIAGNMRTFVAATRLTGAYLANLGDFAIMKHTALMNNLPLTGHIRTYMKLFVPNKAGRTAAIRAGLGAESATSLAMALQRVVGPLEGGAFVKRMADVVFRSSLLTPHNQAAKWASGMETMGMFADLRKTKFEDLPMVDEFIARGITKEDWDLFRSQAVHDEAGFHLLRPIDLFNKEGRVNRRVAEKFMDYTLDMMRYMVPSADSRVLATLGHTVDPRTWRGQLWKSASMFMAFPTTIMMVHGRNGLRQATGWGRLKYLSTFFLMLTVGGAFVTQMKELAKGRDPLDMTTGQFWLRAALNGGSFGMAGDAILGPGSLTDLASGANVRFAQEVKDIIKAGEKRIQQMIEGERLDPDLERKLVQFFGRNGPWIWQMRMLMERNVLDELLKEADPQAYRRLRQMEKRRERELGQESWWGVGEDSPRRGPDFGAALGSR